MDWSFSIGWMILGLIITAAGVFVVSKYQLISDNLLSGVSSYDRCKFWGVITIIVGFLVTANIHTLLLSLFVSIVFKK